MERGEQPQAALTRVGIWVASKIELGVQMVLCMARPFKHPKTGVYYFRKVVPDDMRALIGKPQETERTDRCSAAIRQSLQILRR